MEALNRSFVKPRHWHLRSVPCILTDVLRRASPHCMVVNLVRSGRKQPQLFTASAGGKARHPFQYLGDPRIATRDWQALKAVRLQ